MGIFDFLIEIIADALYYPLGWLLFSWLLWLLLIKLKIWSHLTLSMMLVYSASILVVFFRSWHEISVCLKIELCYPSFSLLQFLPEIAFWLIILYWSIIPASKLRMTVKQPQNRWIIILLCILAIWHILAEFLRLFYLSHALTSSNILLFSTLLLLVPWVVWMLLKIGNWIRPNVSAMMVYTASAMITIIRLWDSVIICENHMEYCQEIFSLSSFLTEIVIWFISLYTLMKLVSKMEGKVLSDSK